MFQQVLQLGISVTTEDRLDAAEGCELCTAANIKAVQHRTSQQG